MVEPTGGVLKRDESAGRITRAGFLKLGSTALAGATLAVGILQRPVEAAIGRTIALGIYAGNDQWGNTSRVDAYTRLVGVTPGIVSVFQAFRWEGSYVDFPVSGLNRLGSKYPLVMLSWEPHSGGSASDSNPVTLDAILAGTHDAYISSRARDIVAFGKRILIRLGHEMNCNSYSYGAQWDRAKAHKYARMWRRVHGIFERVGANRYAEWVWCPNVRKPVFDSLPFSEYYPGDAYVDWLGLDGYNWGASRDMPWYSFEEIFKHSLDELYAVPAVTKKVIIGETACHDAGGDKAQWLKDMKRYLKNGETPVRGVCYFHYNQDGANWRVDRPKGALRPYHEMADDRQFQGDLSAS